MDLDLVDTLMKVNAVNIFAPNDDAFAKLAALDDLSNEDMKNIILRHVVIYTIPINDLYYGYLNMMGGEDVQIETNDGGHQIKYNGGISNVVTPDVLKPKTALFMSSIKSFFEHLLDVFHIMNFLDTYQKIHDMPICTLFIQCIQDRLHCLD